LGAEGGVSLDVIDNQIKRRQSVIPIYIHISHIMHAISFSPKATATTTAAAATPAAATPATTTAATAVTTPFPFPFPLLTLGLQ